MTANSSGPRRWVALDFETAVAMDHVVEIGCVEIVEGRLSGRVFHELVRPLVAIDAMTSSVHGITMRQVADKPTFAEVADRLLGFIGDAGIIAHAEYVERNILAKEMARLGLPILGPDRFVCTLRLARRCKRFARNGLRDVSRGLGIDVSPSRGIFHDALADARMAALIYLALAEETV